MAETLHDRLRRGFPDFTKAEKAVASYMLANLRQLPFETAASIAENIGVSHMTVSRFLRALGYKGLSEVKQDLRDNLERTPLLISDRIDRIRRNGAKNSALWDNLELEVRSLVGVYELIGTAVWRRVVQRLATAARVRVAGFQTVSGIAADFAGRLEYLRAGVRYLDGRDGTFAGLFAEDGPGACLVLIEMRRYTKLSHLLAQKSVEKRVPLVIICDNHCYWAREYTEDVLVVNTTSTLFWDGQAPFVSLFNLLLNDVIAALGDGVAKRTRLLAELQASFDSFRD
jgi:DNA-binding MurR/RpiR family transcriptional regulator